MTERAADVIVVGGGVMGAATAWRLAREGQRVRLFEQFPLGHHLASSHGPSRMIRLAYAEPEYVHLGREAFRLWDDLIADSGEPILQRTGGIDIGLPDALAMDEVATTYETLGMPYERLDEDALRHRFPQLNPPAGTIGLYQQDYGILAASRCVATLAARARAHGAEIRDATAVLALAPDGDGVRVRTASGEERADRVIVTAGSWIAPLLAPLGIELRLTVLQEQLAFFRVDDPEAHRPPRLPLIIHRFPGTTSLGSVFPIFDHAGIKMMIDRVGPAVDPANPDRAIDSALLARLREYAMTLLPGVTGEILETTSCRYTMTADEDFVIDRHPEYAQIVFASPCSGHGFKFAPVIGQMLTDLALRGETPWPTARFRYDRPALRQSWEETGVRSQESGVGRL
ncbi:MAG: N-methyl-L-tryptophan oxidase [Thermomicrobiales bacterium]